MLVRVALCVAVLSVLAAAATVEQLEKKVEQLGRQLMLQQLFVEERIRTDGGSGLKQARTSQQGTLPYHADTINGPRIASIHEHSNHLRAVGLGEFAAVLNGVEFRTRHNDHNVVQPEEVTRPGGRIEYDKVRDIPFPAVPPEVIRQGSVEKQIVEMREWFKAWKDQDPTVRDYRKYFKPVLCYLEGGWTLPSGDKIEEPFPSDRHSIDAETWLELQETVRFQSMAGRKDPDENYAYLPTTLMSADNGSTVLAQWNYRVLCHPLERDLSTKRLSLIDDITARIAFGHSMSRHLNSRAARFRVAPQDSESWTEKIINYDLLDELMSEIPGKDGYGNGLQDVGMNNVTASSFKSDEPLHAGYYHRWFKATKDAMGIQNQHRGYSDENLFMARTTQPKIAPIAVEKCKGTGEARTCFTTSQQWTYAIPLELMYLTPIHSWNPYNIEYKGDAKSAEGLTVTANGRTGRSMAKALNGTHRTLFYHTPAAFYAPLNDTGDAADTAGKELWVLDSTDTPRETVASGMRIHMPGIAGVGRLRVRYPIMPLSYEGSAAWKELTALKNMVQQPKLYSHMFYDNDDTGKEPTTVTLLLKTSTADTIDQHDHLVYVPREDLQRLIETPDGSLDVTCTEALGHTHMLTLRVGRDKNGEQYIYYSKCGSKQICWDQHPIKLSVQDD